MSAVSPLRGFVVFVLSVKVTVLHRLSTFPKVQLLSKYEIRYREAFTKNKTKKQKKTKNVSLNNRKILPEKKKNTDVWVLKKEKKC